MKVAEIAAGLQRVDLIFHQSDQRREHNSNRSLDWCPSWLDRSRWPAVGNRVTCRLPVGKNDERVSARQRPLAYSELRFAKVVEKPKYRFSSFRSLGSSTTISLTDSPLAAR